MQEPPVPEKLLERTLILARTVRQGREAEKRLAESPPRSEKEQLAAQSILGRLFCGQFPPEGANPEKLAEELRGKEEFRRAVEQPADALLSDLQDGRLLRSLAAKRAKAEKKSTEQPQLQDGNPPQRNAQGKPNKLL